MSASGAGGLGGAGDKPALVTAAGVRTFDELADRSARLARVLRGLGAGPGERVALMLPNSSEWFETNVAVARLGAQLVPVNWHLRRDELAWILADSDARVLVTGTELAAEAGAAVARLPRCHVLAVGEDYDAAIAAADPYPDSELDSEAATAPGFAPAIVLYTSGTTGRPKGVVHEQASTARSRQTHVDLWGFTRDDVHLLVGPAYHGAPWSYAVTHLALGATVVVMPRWDAREFLRLVAEHRVTNTFLVPTHFARLLEVTEPERSGRDLSSLRLVLHGAAACPIAVKERIIDFFAPAEVWEFYGFSEAGRVSRIGPAEWRAHPGSAGRPFEGVHVAILDDTGAEVPAGETGWIHVVPGHGDRFHYRNNPDATAAVTAPTRFGPAVTGGDLGHLDADGYLYVTDRSAELVVRGGVNVYPREAEDALHTHPAVVDCAAFGVPDPVYGERLVALVEVGAGADVGSEVLSTHVRSRLAAYKCPEEIRIVDALPRDPNGKVRKGLLREAARRQASAADAGDNEALWERHARWWQREFADGGDPEYRELILPLVARHLQGARRVLDIGCGEGQVARHVAETGIEVVGIDPTMTQIGTARERGGGPSYARARAEALPCRSAAFDAVLLCLALEHVDAFEAAIDEVARTLEPGGRFVLLLCHPLLQAPGSGWVDDRILGERYWRVGAYLRDDTVVDEVAPDVDLVFIHRPLSRYVHALGRAGLLIDDMEEPSPPAQFLADTWGFPEAATIPRVLLIRARRID